MLTYSLEMFLSCCHGDTCFVIDLKALQYRAPFISQTCRDSLIFDVVHWQTLMLWSYGSRMSFGNGPYFVLDRFEPEQFIGSQIHWLPSGLLWRTGVAVDCPGLCTLSSCVCKRQPSGPGNGCLIASCHLANLSWTFREGLNCLLERVMDTVRRCSLWLMFEFLFHSLLEQVIVVELL